MGKSSDYEYLDEERKKLWFKVNSVETQVNERIDLELAKIPEDYISESRQASKKVSEFKNRSEESKNTILQLQSEAESKLNQINDLFNSVSELNESIEKLSNEITENDGKVRVILNEVEVNKLSIEEDVEKLSAIFEDFTDLTEKISRLKELVRQSDDTSSKIETLHKSLLDRKKDIDQIYYEIFGYTATLADGTKTEVQGLKDSLAKAYTDLNNDISLASEKIEEVKNKTNADYDVLLNNSNSNLAKHLKDWDLKYIGLEYKIEALLPNALTAGLSSAYSEKKNVEIQEYKKLNRAFMSGIAGLIFVSIIPFIVSIYSLYNNKTFEQVILDMPRMVLSILPLYIPVLWVAYSSNKKMNLSKRLSEEYSHKEVLSKTFEGLSTQINNISDEKVSNDLRNKLLYNILEVSSENPGKLISDYNKSDHPLMDALDKSVQLATAFEKLEKIPGLSKLADKMNKKSRSILSSEDDKANKGLDYIDTETD